MHLMITKTKYKGNTKEYAKIVHSHRDKKGVSHPELVRNLGPIRSEDDRKKFLKILEETRGGEDFVKEKDIKILTAKEFGVTYTTNSLLEKYELNILLKNSLSANKAEFSVYEIIKALIINRLLKPSSDLSAYDWIKKYYSENLQLKEQYIYRSLDYLIKNKEQIEIALFQKLKEKLKLDLEKTHYDLTSSYFEGTCCTIALFGHTRDHRKDRKQIVIGLVMCDKIPVMHDVYKGNTADAETLGKIQKRLISFGIKSTVIVSDNGIMTQDNQEYLESINQKYLLCLDRRKSNIVKELLVKNITSKENQYAKEVKKEKIMKDGREIIRRYLLCLDKQTRNERLKKLNHIKNQKQKGLKELQEKYEKSQKSKKKNKITRESLMFQAHKLLGKNKRIFSFSYNKGLVYSLNKTNWEYEKKIAGKFLLVTNTGIGSHDAMKSYKELQVVENAFDEIKNFLDMRPIYHWKEERVKAHVFICVLAFLIECLIEKLISQSARKVINELETIKVVKFSLGNKTKNGLTEVSKKCGSLFKSLKVHTPFL